MKSIKYLSVLVLGIALLFSSIPVFASSHREAPFIAEMPKVDGTDFYLFNSYETGKEDFVTIIANYQPLQDGYGGPNFFALDPEAIYEIHVDNNGDAREDITFQFQAMNTLNAIPLDIGGKKVGIPFINVGGIGPGVKDNMSTNVVESYTAKVIRGNRRVGKADLISNADTKETVFIKPTDNIGDKSIPNYETYAKNHIYNVNIPGCSKAGKVFVGQRKEGFVVDLGGTFDLVNFNPLGDPKGGINQIADKNVTSFAVEVPKSCLTGTGTIIGAWTTSSLPKSRLFSKTSTFEKPVLERGPYAQVSRLSAPLVNELFIGLKDKNKFNASEPKDDSQFADYVTNPTLPTILEVLFGGAGYKAPAVFPRTDLVAAFLTGLKDLNQNSAVAEMLRLNTATPAVPAAQQKPLAALESDNAGFPNGRRPGDDVVDIELRVASGALLPTDQAPAGKLAITDGAFTSAADFDETFPYLKTPNPGKVASK